MELNDQALVNLMTDAHVIASVGVISDPATEGFRVASYQQSQGYKIIPVTQAKDMILGHPTVASVDKIEGSVDIVNVFGHPNEVGAVTDAAIRAGAKAIWFEPGTADHGAEARAREAGLAVISNKSFESEHRRLLSHRMQ